ncbi:MAG: OB-fold domain-containing protein [Desulfobacterales bacterium]|nr:OB-fold domain-containing protein [Desulfobacterales bacterium]
MNRTLDFNQYQQGLEEDRLLGLRCKACATVTVPPQAVCRSCAGRDLAVEELEMRGTLRSFTVIRVAAEGLTPPFVVALVETASGAWVMGNMEEIDPDAVDMALMGRAVTIGSKSVPGDIYAVGDMRSLTFRLA